MPWGDRTGPSGLGPRTGRGAGHCSGFAVPGYQNQGFGSRFYGGGRGRSSGRIGGWGRWFGPGNRAGESRLAAPAPLSDAVSTPTAERRVLEQQVKLLENQLSGIRKRLDELTGNGS